MVKSESSQCGITCWVNIEKKIENYNFIFILFWVNQCCRVNGLGALIYDRRIYFLIFFFFICLLGIQRLGEIHADKQSQQYGRPHKSGYHRFNGNL